MTTRLKRKVIMILKRGGRMGKIMAKLEKVKRGFGLDLEMTPIPS